MLLEYIKICLLILAVGSFAPSFCKKPTNFIIVLADDVGYGDFHVYGHPTQEKGAVDQIAEEGMKFTQWYSAAPLCSPSRAAMLTGRHAVRSGIFGENRVFLETASGGIPKSETTIAESLRDLGYQTGIVGKWHLGINEFETNDGRHLPHNHGFDFVGHVLPFSMIWRCDPNTFTPKEMSERCFLVKDREVVEQPINLDTLTERLRNDSVDFIQRNKHQPFFLYLSMPQTHSRLFCAEKFCNTSRRGLYGDNVNEMSWLLGEVVSTLKKLGLDSDTLLFFLSDHGPQVELCVEGGSTGGLRGGKASTWEGGVRVPSIAWWPGTIKASSTSSEPLSTMDIFPTILELAGGEVDAPLDGISIAKLLLGKDNTHRDPIHDIIIHYCSDIIMAVRIGSYKIHYFTQLREPADLETCKDGHPVDDYHTYMSCNTSVRHEPPLVFNVDQDPGELYPLNPEPFSAILEEAANKVEAHKRTVVPVPSQLQNLEEHLRPCCNPPSCTCGYLSRSKDEL